MISEKIKQALLSNWGAKADAMDCYAEVKFIDPITHWACYIYAMNPDNDDDIACLVYDDIANRVEVCDWSMNELLNTYNREGEYPQIDHGYIRMKASELLKKLNEI
jgi:hypothetical protein